MEDEWRVWVKEMIEIENLPFLFFKKGAFLSLAKGGEEGIYKRFFHL
jgi:hypothetical protein